MRRINRDEKNLDNVKSVVERAINADQTTRLLDTAGSDAPVLAVNADIFGLSSFNEVVRVFIVVLWEVDKRICS